MRAANVLAALLVGVGCARDPERPPAPPTLLDVCRDSVDEPLDVACLIGREVGGRSSCEERPLMGCPSMSPPGFAMLSCRYEPGELPPVWTSVWVPWTSGSLVDVPSSTESPSTIIAGAQRKESLQGAAIERRFEEIVARLRALGCRSEPERGGRDRAVFAACGELEVDVSTLSGLGDADGVTVLVGPPALHDCKWAGRNGGTGTRPRPASAVPR